MNKPFHTKPRRVLIGRLKRDPSRYNLGKPEPGTCGSYAKKSGTWCTSRELYPNGRCKFHGGVVGKDKPIPSTAGAKAGTQTGLHTKNNIYEVGLLKEEKGRVFEDVVKEVGTLDSELHMARIFLRRAYAAQRRMTEAREELKKYESNPDEWILIAARHGYMKIDRYEIRDNGRLATTPEIRRDLQDTAYRRITRKKTDYTSEIRKYTNIIKNLEGQRKELLENRSESSEEFIRELASSLRAFTDTVTGRVHNKAAFGAGNYPDLKQRKGSDE